MMWATAGGPRVASARDVTYIIPGDDHQYSTD
jgi:hypothetical protein